MQTAPMPPRPRQALAVLAAESRAAGHGHLDRLLDDWEANTNRFDRPGECFRVAYAGERLVACGGLNIDPFVPDGSAGRLRRLYVLGSAQGCGIGRRLVAELLASAGAFGWVTVRAGGPGAVAFYDRLGFERVTHPDRTHAWRQGRGV